MGGQGAIAEPFSAFDPTSFHDWLFDLLLDPEHPDAPASLGAVLSQTPLDELLKPSEDSDAPQSPATVTFEDGKPTIRAVSENPEEGTTRTVVARLDESGTLLETEETLDRSDGSSTHTLRTPLGENAVQTIVTQKNAQGDVVETTTTTRETEADGSQRAQISRTWADGSAYHEESHQTTDGKLVESRVTEVAADGSSRTEETTVNEDGSRRTITTERDANGNVLETLDVEAKETTSWQYGDAVYAEIDLSDGTWLYVHLGYHTRSVEGEAATGKLREVRIEHNGGAKLTAAYQADGTARSGSYEREVSGTEVETETTYHPDGSRTERIDRNVFGGDYERETLFFAPDGRLASKETFVQAANNGDRTTTLTTYHEDGSTHVAIHRESPMGGTLEKTEVLTYADGSQVTARETYPNDGTRRETTRKDADGFLYEQETWERDKDGGETTETLTYAPDGSRESVLVRTDSSGNGYRVETTMLPTQEGGHVATSRWTFTEGTSHETWSLYDSEGQKLQETYFDTRPDGEQWRQFATYGPGEKLLTTTAIRLDAEGNKLYHTESRIDHLEDGSTRTEVVDYLADDDHRTVTLEDAEGRLIESTTTKVELLPEGGQRVTETYTRHPRNGENGSERETVVTLNEAGEILSVTVSEREGGNETTYSRTRLADGSIEEELTQTTPGKRSSVTITTRLDGTKRFAITSEETRGTSTYLREETREESEDGQVLARMITETETFNTGKVVETRIIRGGDGATQIYQETRNSLGQLVIESEALIRPDGTQREVKREFLYTSEEQDASPAVSDETTSETSPDGDVLERKVIHASAEYYSEEHLRPDGSTYSIIKDSRNDPRIETRTVDTKIEWPDGSSHQTIVVNHGLGDESRTEIETAADGTQTVRVQPYSYDGIARETVHLKDAQGNTYQTTTTEILKDGSRVVSVTTPLEDGQEQTIITTVNAEGQTIDVRTRYLLPDKRTLEVVETRNADGLKTLVETERDENGTLLSATTTVTGLNGSQTIEVTTPQADGSSESVLRKYDADGKLLETTTSRTWDENNTRFTERHTDFHDGREQTLYTKTDLTSNWVFYSEVTSTKNVSGYVTTIKVTTHPDGSKTIFTNHVEDGYKTLIRKDASGNEVERTVTSRRLATGRFSPRR